MKSVALITCAVMASAWLLRAEDPKPAPETKPTVSQDRPAAPQKAEASAPIATQAAAPVSIPAATPTLTLKPGDTDLHNQTEPQGQTREKEADLERRISVSPAKASPNEVFKGKATYRGGLVQLFKTDNPLQLINPFAPARYGSALQNTGIDPVTGRPQGIVLISITR